MSKNGSKANMNHKSTYWRRCNAFVVLMIILQNSNGNDASVQYYQQTVENKFILSATHQSKIKQVELPTDQELIVRLPSNTLLKYSSYKDVSILHFRVPSDARTAYFSFKAVEESKSPFQRKCKAKDVTLHLKANSFPVISPENITFPNNFLNPDQRFKVYHLQFESNNQQHRIDIQGPQIGSWFAVAFISWTDPNNERIEQQGLSASCDTLLLGELSVSRFFSTIVYDGQINHDYLTSKPIPFKYQRPLSNAINGSHNTEASSDHNSNVRSMKFKEYYKRQQEGSAERNEAIYKFYVPEDFNEATALIAFQELCESCLDIGFFIQANAFPATDIAGENLEGNEYNYLHSVIIRPNQTDEIPIKFYVQPKSWHYAMLKFVSPSNSTIGEGAVSPAEALRQENQIDESRTPELNVSYTLRIVYKQMEPHNKTTNMTAKLMEPESPWQPQQSYCGIDFYSLLRQSYHEFFMYDYDLQPDANGTVPALLNLTAQATTGFGFELGEVNDIGGTLTFAVSMKHDPRFRSELKATPPTTSPLERGILAEKLVGDHEGTELPIDRKSLTKTVQTNQSMQIIVCMRQGVPGVPTWPDKCRYGERLMQATSIVNNTDVMGLIHVPFPESGHWYVTMGLFCHEADTARATIIDSVKEFVRTHSIMLQKMRTPCACANSAERLETCIMSKDCLASMNETETLKIKECMMDFKCTDDYLKMTQRFETHHKLATEQHLALDNCSTSVIFSISSSPCVAGRCGRFGRCYNYMSGGFVFSTCVCMKGYRGWDCTEESQVPSSMSILVASLLLTLSNLLFIPSVYLAIKRHYYTEGIIYFFAMFFSIFYHACDSGEDEYSFCLVKIGVLQFCDFYCGLLAIWVTLIAMAHIPPQFVSLLHMFGAILLAFGTELDKQSLWVFLAPALTGICLISTSWGIRCSKSRKCFPARKYLIIFMPLGMVLVMIGLVCYAFLQTKQNYHIVHSIWHMVMALSIMCLLPSPKTFIPKCEHSDL